MREDAQEAEEPQHPHHLPEKDFFIDNLLVRIHLIIVMIRWTGLAPWENTSLSGGGGERDLGRRSEGGHQRHGAHLGFRVQGLGIGG